MRWCQEVHATSGGVVFASRHAGLTGAGEPVNEFQTHVGFMAIGLALLLAGPFTASAVVHPPDVNPDDFSSALVIDNRYFPLVPGTLFVYEGETDGVPTSDRGLRHRGTRR